MNGQRRTTATPPNLFRAEELTYPQVRAFKPERTIAFLPVSSLEIHGPHLPLGVDVFTARWGAEEAGRLFAEAHPDWTVAVFLPLTLGTDVIALPGSVNATQRDLYRVLIDQAGSLARAGYRYVVVTSGHAGPRHVSGLEAACRAASRRYGITMFTPSIAAFWLIMNGERFEALEHLLGRQLTPEERAGILCGEHAATIETSYMLAERPDLVDPIYRELGPHGPPPFRPILLLARPIASLLVRGTGSESKRRREQIASGLALDVGWLLNTQFGYGGPEVTYMGDPSVATAELGEAYRRLLAEETLVVVEKVLSGELRPEDVRSKRTDFVVLHPLFFRRLVMGVVALAAALLMLRGRRRRRAQGVQIA
jgi:creatinine amidohydrolase/Fe(II)-dependent formamide hydrolase-like protein